MSSNEVVETFTSMASTVTIRIVQPNTSANEAISRARAVIEDVAAACTRFDATSPLMRANAAPSEWHIVPRVCRDAIAAAFDAYQATEGRFDPRVLRALEAQGYASSRSFTETPLIGTGSLAVPHDVARWNPEFDGRRVRIGDEPIDLGGIGKGLAVRWAAQELEGCGSGYLIDAGGDLVSRGSSPDGGPWLVGVEDPWNAEADPLVVLDATDASIATSSIRLRSWVNAGRVRHHLIDPRTGEPGGDGLISVTVIGADVADSEVWSKALFLEGTSGIAAAATSAGVDAVWVDTHGGITATEGAQARIVWQVAHANN